MISKIFKLKTRKTFNLCVLGNSHVGALKLAWEDVRESYPEIELTFFASPGRSTSKLNTSGRKITPTNTRVEESFKMTSGGLTEIDLSRYDAFLCYGTFGWMPLCDSPMSSAFRYEVAKEVVKGSNLLRHLSMLSKGTQKPLIASTAPLPAPSYRERGELLLPIDGLREILEECVAEKNGAQLIWQPPETLVEGGFATKAQYSTGSIRLESSRMSDKVHPDTDDTHMNKSYGEIWLKAFLPQLKIL